MADQKDSQLGLTTTLTGCEITVLLPDGVSPTGYEDYRMTHASFKADLQSQITANTNDVAANTSDISDLQDITSRQQYVNQVSNFQFSQPANSIINYINLRSTGAATFSISGSVTGVIQATTNLTDGELQRVDKITDSEPGQTITFTITGTVSAEIYYNKNTI